MLTMRELAVVADAEDGPLVTVTDDGETTRYRVVAAISRTRRRSSRCWARTRSGS
jgi:hypothetical protein